MPGFHHSVAVLPLPFRRAVVKFRCSVKITQENSVPLQPYKRQKAAVTVLPLIGSSSIFPLPLSHIAGQPTIGADYSQGIEIRNGSGNGNGVRKPQRRMGTAKRQRKNGSGMVETGHQA